MQVLSKNLSITKGLVDLLKELYPNTIPVDEISLEKLRYLQGQQAIIHKIADLYEQINNEEI